MFTLEEKLDAVNLVYKGMSYRQAGKAFGVSCNTIWTWHKALKGTTSDLYAFVKPSKGKDVSADLENLPDDPDELKKIIFDMQFETDLKEAMVDILKKTQASTRRNCRTKRKLFWWTH